ncbi:MAG: hypothetical protein ACREOO_03530 [bacterium]
MRTHLHDAMIKTAVALLFLLGSSLQTQAQIPQRVFAGVDKTFDDHAPTLGLHVSSLSTPEWKNAGWPGFAVRTVALSVATGSPKILLGGPNGVLRPFTNPTGWQLLTAWRLTDILDVKIDPDDPGRIFAATASGIYLSANNGREWKPSNDGLNNSFISCLLIDTKQEDRILAGTEEGLFESTDNGDHWRLLAFPGVAIRALLREPESWPGIFWVGTEYHGLYESFDGGETFEAVDMERDSVSVYALAGGGAHAPIYAGVFEQGLYRASSPGENWSHVEDTESLGTVLCILPMDELRILFVGTHQKGVMKSADSGRTWQSFGLSGAPVRALVLGEVDWSKP